MLGSDSFLWVKDHHLHHQVNCLLTCIWDQLTQRGWNEFWESKTDLCCKLVALWPFTLSGTSQNSTSLVDLISFIVSREEWSHQIKFGHDSSQSKYIYWRIIIRTSEKNLRSSVPSCTHIIREWGSRSNFPSKTEICDFDSFTLYQQIFRF